jgi:HD-GYP domain-containing protein (c-di-GMP phosphodiesterase class II)
MTAAVPHSARDDRFFLRAVGELGDQCQVATTRALFDVRGTRVLESGARFDAPTAARLAELGLNAPAEESLTTDRNVTGADLRRAAEACMKSHPFFERMVADPRTRSAILESFETLFLPPSVVFLLTLARTVRPQMFEHSVRTGITAGYLAHVAASSRFDAAIGVAAGMLHDLGMLFIDPVVLDPRTKIDESVRHRLYLHPLIAKAMLEPHFQYSTEVISGVVEHHERLDGSGYPRGLSGKTISPWGRLMGVAQITTAMFGSGRLDPETRLSMLLRLNRHRYDARLVGEIERLLKPGSNDGATKAAEALPDPVARLRELGEQVAAWPAVAQKAVLARQVPAEQVPNLAALTHQVASIARMMAETGVAVGQLEWLDAGDEAALAELSLLAREMSWQLDLAANQLQRMWKVASAADYPRGIADWLAMAQSSARTTDADAAVAAASSAKMEEAITASETATS